MGKISSFITGAAVGVAAALMLAPRTGEETRAMVAEKANAFADEAKDFSAGMPGTAKDAYNNVRDKGAAFIKDAPAKVQEFAGAAKSQAPAAKSAPADSDELREKIEAARKRIAAQVMENAENSKAVDIAAEAAEQVAEQVETAEEAEPEAEAEAE